jgi:hypothetical protein
MRLEQFTRDIHYGLRQPRRNPGFSTIAIATLALGMGGVAAIFGVTPEVGESAWYLIAFLPQYVSQAPGVRPEILS